MKFEEFQAFSRAWEEFNQDGKDHKISFKAGYFDGRRDLVLEIFQYLNGNDAEYEWQNKNMTPEYWANEIMDRFGE